MVISKKTIIFQGFRGVQLFPGVGGGGGGGGGSNFFQGGPNAYFYKTLITCDFTREGGQDPYSPSGSAYEIMNFFLPYFLYFFVFIDV